jgi:hypothetical protein
MKQQQYRGGNMRGRGRGRGRGRDRGGKFDSNGQRIKSSTTNLPLELKAEVEADGKYIVGKWDKCTYDLDLTLLECRKRYPEV